MNRNLSRQEAREQAISYADSHKVDKSVIMTVAGATNSRIDYNAFEKGDGKMCTLFEEIAKENESRGRQEGRQEGEARQIVEMGQEFGLSESDILLRLQKKLNVSEETAQAFLQMFGK